MRGRHKNIVAAALLGDGKEEREDVGGFDVAARINVEATQRKTVPYCVRLRTFPMLHSNRIIGRLLQSETIKHKYCNIVSKRTNERMDIARRQCNAADIFITNRLLK